MDCHCGATGCSLQAMSKEPTIKAERSYGRGGGRPLAEMREQLDEWRAGSAATGTGRRVTIRSGGLALHSSESAFISTGSVTFFGWHGYDVTVDVEVAAEPQPHVVIAGLHVHPRDGKAITATSLQAAHLGEAMRAAVSNLTTARHPQQHVVSALRPKPNEQRRSTLDHEIERTAQVYSEAIAAGTPTRSVVQAELAKLRGVSPRNVSDAGERIRQARQRGLIPPTGGTTRPRATKTEGTP